MDSNVLAASGWRVLVDGVDQTAIVEKFSVTWTLNERTRAQIVFTNYQPDRLAEVVAYAKDGTTKLFGGMLLQRNYAPYNLYDADYRMTCECADYLVFTDWLTVTFSSPAVSLKTVLTQLVDALVDYGVTLAPTQVDGPEVQPFQWSQKRISDALRELSDQTGYVVDMSPDKTLRMYEPGSEPAPYIWNDVWPTKVQEVTWQDNTNIPANTVKLICGPDGIGTVANEQHFGDGVTRSWPLNAPYVAVIGAISGVGMEGGWPLGRVGVDDDNDGVPFLYDQPTNSVIQKPGLPVDHPVFAAGEAWFIWYEGMFPFTVTATTGATPVIEKVERRGDLVSIPAAQAIADAMLTDLGVDPTEMHGTTDVDGFFVGQALTVYLDPLRRLSGVFVITSVALDIVLDTDAGDAYWQYTIDGSEQVVRPRSYLEAWRTFGEGAVTAGAWDSASGGSPPDTGGGGSGGGGGAAVEEVFVGPGEPTATTLELWYDTDEPAPSATIPDHSISFTKLVPIASQTLLGRVTAGTGDIEVLTVLPTAVQNSITRLGTVVAGVWNATPIALSYVAGAGAAGTFVRSNGMNWATSTLILPNAIVANRIVYSTTLNTYGDSPNLTFTGSALALIGNQTLTGFIGSATYASQTTGWRIDAAGGADFRYAFVDEMHAKSFITDLEMALAGGQIISKSVAMVASTFTVPGLGAPSPLNVRDLPSMANTAAFEPGDTIVLRRYSRTAGTLNIADCIGTVSGYVDQPDGTQTWTFTRGTGAAGGSMSGGVVDVDALALDYGISGNGYYEVSAVDGTYGSNSPYAQIVTWTGAPTGANKVVRTRFGKLTGITGTPNEFGMLAGTYAAANGSYFRASNTTFELHNITAEWWAGFTPVVVVAPGGGSPYISLGNPAYPKIGQGPGIVLAYNASAGLAQFWAYSPGGSNYLVFDGSLLYWKAANTTLDTAGNLTATSATLSGAITATSGTIAGDLVVGTGGYIRSGANSFNAGIGWWLDYNGGVPRFRIGNPNADRVSWDGTTLTVRSGKLLIDGTASGHIGMGAAPYSLATLNVASDTDDASSYGLLVTNHSGTVATLLTYGDGRLFLGGQLYILPGAWDTTGQGQNPPSQFNGPFGYHELSGWMRVFMYTGSGGGIPPTGPFARGWIPVWLG